MSSPVSFSTLSIHWFFMVSKCSYAALLPGFFNRIRAAEVTCTFIIMSHSHYCTCFMHLNILPKGWQNELKHLWCELPGMFHRGMYALHCALIGCSHSSGLFGCRPQPTCVCFKVPCALFENLK